MERKCVVFLWLHRAQAAGDTSQEEPRSFPNGIDVQWVWCNCNTEAGAAANAGLRAHNHERRILFYDYWPTNAACTAGECP
jgi:hypothetical protein